MLPPDSGDPNRRVRRIAGRDIVFDGEGFFWDPNDWSKEMAEIPARELVKRFVVPSKKDGKGLGIVSPDVLHQFQVGGFGVDSRRL